ncbi:hypothetical protein CHUAL_003179 [Chamberlinius hualienensis]
MPKIYAFLIEPSELKRNDQLLNELRFVLRWLGWFFKCILLPVEWPPTDNHWTRLQIIVCLCHVIFGISSVVLSNFRQATAVLRLVFSHNKDSIVGFCNIFLLTFRSASAYCFLFYNRYSIALLVDHLLQSLTEAIEQFNLEELSQKIFRQVKRASFITVLSMLINTVYTFLGFFHSHGSDVPDGLKSECLIKELNTSSTPAILPFSSCLSVFEWIVFNTHIVSMLFCLILMGYKYYLDFFIMYLVILRIRLFKRDVTLCHGKPLSDGTLWYLQQQHRHLCSIIDEFNSVFSTINTLWFLSETVEIILMVKIIGISLTTSTFESDEWAFIFPAFVTLGFLIRIIMSSSINSKMLNSLTAVVDLATNIDLYRKTEQYPTAALSLFHIYTVRMSLSPSLISALGFFDIGTGLIASVSAFFY